MINFDPSLSLHDDKETALVISGGYFSEEGRQCVHLFEIDVPKIELIGYILAQVQSKKKSSDWFEHRGVFFCSNWERTERYVLYEIPFLKKREVSHTIIRTKEELEKMIAPFKEKQEKLYKEWLLQQKK